MFRSITMTLVCLTAIVASGCDQSQSSSTSPASAAAANWKLDAAPAQAVDIAAAKASAKEGDTIALRGRIGGRHDPITPTSGLFVMVDSAIPSCADNPNDACRTPWDYCCEATKLIAANAATVQLRNTDGASIAVQDGELSPLDEVIVVGTVAPRSNDQTLVIHATGVFVVPAQPSGAPAS